METTVGIPAGTIAYTRVGRGPVILLVSLRIPSATVIGHSLGGGVAMQFAYQFPERIDCLVLISSGGLGAEVTPLLRFASSAPGAGAVLRTVAAIPTPVVSALFRTVAGQRRTFIGTARSVIDWRGQSISATR